MATKKKFVLFVKFVFEKKSYALVRLNGRDGLGY